MILPLEKCIFVLSVLFVSALSVENSSQNETAEFLSKLYNFALQSRQTHSFYPSPYPYKYSGKYPEYYQNYPLNSYSQYPGSSYLSHIKNPHIKLPSQGHFPYKYVRPYDYPVKSHPFSKPTEAVMEVLDSIARNDNLQCVPKLICEVTSGNMPGRQQGFNLPINLNMESLLGFLSVFNGAQSSPLLYFGKAALVGFSSKGNTRTCNYAYPKCPSDPDKVVQYLNNHKGGFFRFFNNVAPTQNIHQIPYWGKAAAEQRIQTSVVDNTPKYQESISFPKHEEVLHNFYQSGSFRSEKGLKFPNNDLTYNNEVNGNGYDFPFYSHGALKFPNEHFTRKPKELIYHTDYNFDFQRPLPNHKPTPTIFPDRTGTGNLRLDPEELQEYQRPISYQDDDVRIVFNGFNNVDASLGAYDRNVKGFTFPL